MIDPEDQEATCADFKVGHRVQLHPGTDFWMQGDRFGQVTNVNEKLNIVRVKMDISGRILRLDPKNILKRRPF